MDEAVYNRLGEDRISSRQIDELIGLARGIAADGILSTGEVEFLQKWLAANLAISGQPVVRVLYDRVSQTLRDGMIDEDEYRELFDTLGKFSNRDFELGEVLKSTTLPLCDPPPPLTFPGMRYCFTGTFNYGQRKYCEQAVVERGGQCSSINQKINFLVIGAYATESWKHSTFGNKISLAVEWRGEGIPISIVSEAHWIKYI